MIVGLYSTVPQSGKSTVAREFILAGYQKLSLASPVKESLHLLLVQYGVLDANEYLWGEKKDKIIPGVGVTGGYLMSTFATDYMRKYISEDFWLDILLRKVRPGVDYIVDDMRFPNEYAAFDVKIKVERPNVNSRHGRSSLSEGQLDKLPFDYVIFNDRSLDELVWKTQDIIKELSKRG